MDAGAKFVTYAPILPVIALVMVYAKPPWTPVRVAGLILFTGGFSLVSWARLTLGNSFSITPQAKALVTGGIYAKVRHPVYVFGILMITGLLLYINRPWLLFILMVLVPMQIARARAEEKVLIKKFGDDYLAYKKTTWL